MYWFSRELERVDPDLNGPMQPPNMTDKEWKRFQAAKSQKSHNDSLTSHPQDDEKRFKNMNELITGFEKNFSRHLQILLDCLNHYAATETVVLLSLCARLATANQGTEFAGPRPEGEAVA